MTWLNALLAFTLAMIVFCTMVSAITELVQHILARRQQGLEWMLKRFYLDALRPLIGSLGGRLPGLVTEREVTEFLRSLASNLSARDKLFGPSVQRTELSVEELITRLPETEIGKTLLRHLDGLGGVSSSAGRQELTRVIDRVKEQFARYEQDATANFGQRAKSLSVLLAIGLAFCLNIDAVRLFSTFLTDQELTQQFLKKADKLTELKADARSPDTDAEFAALKQQLQATSALGLPIGTRYFPFCVSDVATDPACAVLETTSLTWLWVRWSLATLLAGALIGLGGPFWFNFFSKLSQVMDTFRPRSGDRPGAAPALPTHAAAPPANDQLTQRFLSAAGCA